MKILVERFDSGSDDTLGMIYIDGKHVGYTIEDEFREVKVKGETRIPAGTYKIRFREQDTPLTLKYKEKYSFFKWHLEVCDVPGFSNIYIHVGNIDKHTDGCLIVGKRIGNLEGKRAVLDSVSAYKEIYPVIAKALEDGEEVEIKYMDKG